MDKVFYENKPGMIDIMLSKGGINIEQYKETNDPMTVFYIDDGRIIHKCRRDIANELLKSEWILYRDPKKFSFTLEMGPTTECDKCLFYDNTNYECTIQHLSKEINTVFDCNKYNLSTIKWIED